MQNIHAHTCMSLPDFLHACMHSYLCAYVHSMHLHDKKPQQKFASVNISADISLAEKQLSVTQ